MCENDFVEMSEDCQTNVRESLVDARMILYVETSEDCQTNVRKGLVDAKIIL